MGRPFTARYDGRCPECQEPIYEGDEVIYNRDDQVVHVGCALEDAQQAVEAMTGVVRALASAMPTPATSTTASAARLARYAPAAATMTVDQFFATPASAPDEAAAQFFADQPVKIMTLEEETEAKVERDRYDRPLIVQEDGGKLPYNRASSYGGQIEDNSNISRWQQQQVVRGMAMHPELAGLVPAVAKGDPWADLDKSTKTALTRIADQAQEYAGSNLKSALGTQIHAATEFVDLGDSLEDKFADLPKDRRELLIERGNAYHRAVQEWGLKYDSVETFGVQDELMVAGTWDRRGFVPWWPQHKQTIVDVKTSSSLDFAGVGFSVQLATYSRMCEYVIESAERIPHEDMNLDEALIVHVDRVKGGHVTLAKVDIAWGWSKATLARQILVARREGKGRVAELDQREAQILTASSRAELFELRPLIMGWPVWLRDLAKERWEKVA